MIYGVSVLVTGGIAGLLFRPVVDPKTGQQDKQQDVPLQYGDGKRQYKTFTKGATNKQASDKRIVTDLKDNKMKLVISIIWLLGSTFMSLAYNTAYLVMVSECMSVS